MCAWVDVYRVVGCYGMIHDLHVVLFLFGVFLVQHGPFFTLLVGTWLQLTETIYCSQFKRMFHGSITTSAMVNIIQFEMFLAGFGCFFQEVVE